MHRSARRGEEVDAAPRAVRVDRFDLVSFDGRDFDFLVACSSGTYVRVLVAEVGASLGCGAHLTRLRRTAIGPFRVDHASVPDALGSPLPLEVAVAHLPSIELPEMEAEAASHGRCLAPADIDGPYAVFAPDRRLIGIWRDTGAQACPEMVVAPASSG